MDKTMPGSDVTQPGVPGEYPDWLRPRRQSGSGARSATVYLGSDLSSRIGMLKQKGVEINVSRVCQAALEESVAQAEALFQSHHAPVAMYAASLLPPPPARSQLPSTRPKRSNAKKHK